jgi:hypothetical protein
MLANGHITRKSNPLTNGHLNGVEKPGPSSKAPKLIPNPIPRSTFSFDTVEDALKAFRNGEFLIVMDDEGRENEGDLIIAAKYCTTEKMAWLVKYSR